MMNLFRFLEGIEGGGTAPLEEGIETCMRYHSGRGIAVLLSDFLTFGDVRRALNALYNRGLETFGLQILGPAEVDPDLGGDVRLVDSETQATLDVTSAADLLSLYEEYRVSFERELAGLCRQRSGRFLSVTSDHAPDWILFDLLRRAGWVE
jgi:hypothetical protein